MEQSSILSAKFDWTGRSCMANSKRKFKLLCHKLSSSLKYIKVRTALRVFNLVLWFPFLFLLETGPNGLVHCNF